MMQEEELVMRDSGVRIPYDQSKHAGPDQDIQPFTISDGIQDGLGKKYTFTSFEMFVTIVVMLSTISGGFLEGYTSPAFPSLLKSSELQPSPNISTSTSSTSQRSLNLDNADNVTENSRKNDSSVTELITELPVNVTEKEEVKNLTKNVEEDVSDQLVTSPEEEEVSSTTFEVLPTPLPLKRSLDTEKSNNGSHKSHLHITEEEGSWLASLLLLGGALGALVSPWLVRMGRRHAMMFVALPRFIGWLLIMVSSTVYSIYVGRFLCGVSIGAVSSATPIYISEVAHPSLRGSLGCVVILGVNVGIFLASLLGTFMDWRHLAGAGAVLVVAYVIPLYWAPNSPSWLVLGRREDEARNALRKLRGRGYSVEEELQQIITLTETRAKDSTLPWKEILTQRRTLFPLLVVAMVTVINRFSGYNAIITYCSLFLHDAVPAVSQYWAANAVYLVQILGTVGAMFLVDSWGRRNLLLSSVAVMGLSLVVITICESFFSGKGEGTWMAVIGTMMYVGAYSIGVGPLTFVLLGELFPLDARDKASAVIIVCNWFFAFIVTKTYFSLEASVGLSGTCLIYAGVCLVGVISLFFLVPETKGRTLAEIEAYFTYNRGCSWGPSSVGRLDQALSGILDLEGTPVDTYSTFH